MPTQLALILPNQAQACLAAAFTLFVFAPNTVADEPAKRFLNRLREEGYYDQGLKYLEICAAKNRLPASKKTDLPLERVILQQESLRFVKTPQQRDERIVAIEKGYKEFLAAAPTHSRRSETQTKLGDLLLDRAQSALEESKKPENVISSESWLSKARQAYTEALELYNQVTEELKPLLLSMDGDKIKSIKIEGKNLKELTELREQYRLEYRQSQILHAKTMELISQTYSPNSPDGRKWLEKSETSFNALIEKTTGPQEAGRRMLCLKYVADIQSQLGKMDEARNSYTRVADNDGEGIFRTYRVQAIVGIVRLDSTEKAAKYEAAIQRGEEALKSATARERDDPDWVDLQLAVAEARLAWAKTLDEKKDSAKFKENRKVARDLLQGLLKRKGPHLVKVKKRLSELGIETVEKVDEKLPVTKAWADTIKAARERLDRAESTESPLSVLLDQLSNADATNKQSIQSQIQTLQDDALRDRKQAIELYQRALRLYKDSNSREEFVDAKFLMTYLHLKTDQNWEAVALSQELLVSGKGTDKALKSGGFALNGLGKIISTIPADRQLAFVPTFERLVNQLNLINPASDEAKNAVDKLVTLDLIHKRYEDAEKHIALAQGNSGGSGASLLGQILWGEYQQIALEHRKNKTEETREELSLKQRAEKLLRSTWDALVADKADKNLVGGVNALASIYLMSDRVDEAITVIDAQSKGALALVNAVKGLEPSVQLEAYRLKLQAIVQASGSGKQELSNENISQVVLKMKALSGANNLLLTSALNNLRIKLQSKLESSKGIEEQAKLANAYGVLIQQLVSVSSDVAILDSAGSSILAIASKMLKEPNMAANGKPLMSIAEAAFSKVAAKPVSELVEAKRKPEEFQYRLAQAKSGAGKFEEAHALFLQSLTTNPNNITFQVEAARNLQLWANEKDSELLKKAVEGAEPNAKKTNVIWGWGKISDATTKKVSDFRDIYFEARLNIAKCVRAMALLEPSPEKKKQGMERAFNKIRETHLFYPELGSTEIKATFEKLLREIQRDLGKPIAGLKEFS
ncbi:MAG TPA: hypothetical protein VM260_21210 [Pirellula sp.]|nr:hypothetical protein [Pirellula sp.]